MDYIWRQFAEMTFRLKVLGDGGSQYQDLFAGIMELRYPGDFQKIVPWGNQGDWKSDGYRTSDKRIYQCYAPTKIEASETKRKITEDLDGAVEKWSHLLHNWTFVHNADKGLPPEIFHHLEGQKTKHPGLGLNTQGPMDLRRLLFDLSAADIQLVLGPIPTNRDFADLGFEELNTVIRRLGAAEPAIPEEIRTVPPDKLEHNRFSDDVADFVRMGFKKAHLVQQFFEQYPQNPILGDEVAQVLSTQYQSLKAMGLTPDDIFDQLLAIVTWSGQTRGEYVGSLAILSHFFETCDVFDEPPRGAAYAAAN